MLFTVQHDDTLSKVLSQQEKIAQSVQQSTEISDITSDMSFRKFNYAVECLWQNVSA